MGSAIAGFILVFAGQAIQASGGVGQADTDAEQLTDRPDAFGSLLAGSIVALIGFVLLGVALSFLYGAAARRSSEMRTTFAPMLPIGAVLIGISGILSVFAFDSISSDFLAGMPTTGDAGETRAEDLISENSLFQAGGFVGIAGLFAFTIGIFYAALHSMRTGLLTRFWATLGMALSVLMLLSQVFGPVGIVGVLVWTVAVSLQAAGQMARRAAPSLGGREGRPLAEARRSWRSPSANRARRRPCRRTSRAPPPRWLPSAPDAATTSGSGSGRLGRSAGRLSSSLSTGQQGWRHRLRPAGTADSGGLSRAPHARLPECRRYLHPCWPSANGRAGRLLRVGGERG